MKTPLHFLLAFGLVLAASVKVDASPDTDAVIAKARAAVGDEAKLDAFHSVHYVGTLETTEPDANGAPQDVKVALEIYFQKPCQQRIVATSADKIEITGLDDYDGWQRVQDSKDSTRWRMTLLSAEQIERLRANAWENLFFYRGIGRVGGEVDDLGTVQIDGKPCRELCFNHGGKSRFYRYFDAATGQLVLTRTGGGTTIRESDYTTIDGIKFAQKIVTETKQPDGKTRVVTVVFSKITINETYAESLFAVPIFDY